MTTKTIETLLSAENEVFISQLIQRGTYQTMGDVINAGVGLLRQRQAFLDDIAEGFRQLDEGEYTEYDQEGLRQRFDQLQERLAIRLRENGVEQ